MSDGYNGWTNWETWQVNLWFGYTFGKMQEDGEQVTSDMMESTVNEYLYGFGVEGMASDIFGGFVGNVNWHELESHYLTEPDDDDDDDDE